MKVLTIDVGTGTQDIYLYDSQLDLENGYKLVLPSPTMILHNRLRQATRRRQPVLLTGVTMGGGPCAWAAEDHVRAGLPVYATPEAARTFNDDLEAVARSGIHIVGEDEARQFTDSTLRLEMRDFDLDPIRRAFAAFGVTLDRLDAIAVAVFDHGNAPPEISDRTFRFDYLDERIRAQNRLSAFAYPADRIPAIMTRLKAVATSSSRLDAPLVVMDTAPAAVLGALQDAHVGEQQRSLVVNVGNFHTLAFRLGPAGIEGVFEHHTGFLNPHKLEGLLRAFARGSLTRADIFDDMGHGALLYSQEPFPLDDQGVVVTGPRRAMLKESAIQPYFAVPFGDMMISGCFGLLAATADVLPKLAEPIRASLSGQGGSGTPPWEVQGDRIA